MGNTTSNVTDSVKAQADSQGGPEIYRYMNVAGDGRLVQLMKNAMKTKNYREVDDVIRNELPKFLYNNGNGENV
jgi:hypothetical protein